MWAAAMLAQIADLLSWWYATANGAVESNPLMGGPLVPVIKIVGIVAIIVLARALPIVKRQIVWTLAFALGSIGAITGVLS